MYNFFLYLFMLISALLLFFLFIVSVLAFKLKVSNDYLHSELDKLSQEWHK